jgi:multimeric flavodoxin WrbA
MAEAAHAGAGSTSMLVPAEQTTPEQFLVAQGYLFVCPENLATMSGAMKEMFDRLYYPLLGRIEGRPYASMIAAGSDGTGAERQIDRICTGWRLRRIAPSMIVNFAAQTPEAILAPKTVPEQQLAECRQLGEAFSEGLLAGIF